MSSLALMRWLEGTPERYDAGMRALTFGRVGLLHAAVARAAVQKPGDRVLEIGCGTGSVTLLLHERGARVTALDQAPEMLERARKRFSSSSNDQSIESIEWREQTAAEIDGLPQDFYDSVVICLCLSDMSGSERAYVLREAARRLVSGGRLVVADEVRPRGFWRRGLQRIWRIPQAALAWLLVGSVSSPIRDLASELRAAGLRSRDEQEWLLGSLVMVIAERDA